MMGRRGNNALYGATNTTTPYYRLAAISLDKGYVSFGNANGAGVGNTYLEAGPLAFGADGAHTGNKLVLNAVPLAASPTANIPIFITGSVQGEVGGWMNIKNGLTIGATDKIHSEPLSITQNNIGLNNPSSRFTFNTITSEAFEVRHYMGSPS